MTKYPSKTQLYVEVIYMDGLKYLARKEVYYEPNHANDMYMKTVDKYTDSPLNVFVFLRHENHNLLKAFRNY